MKKKKSMRKKQAIQQLKDALKGHWTSITSSPNFFQNKAVSKYTTCNYMSPPNLTINKVSNEIIN